MAFVLPDKESDVQDVLDKLSGSGFSQVMEQADIKQVNISLPRFSFQYDSSLIETLQALGMTDAFDAQKADLSGITGNNDLFISQIHQQAKISVNEKETTVSAETHIGFQPTGLPLKVEVFQADRPFLFLLYSEIDHLVVFSGVVSDPSCE